MKQFRLLFRGKQRSSKFHSMHGSPITVCWWLGVIWSMLLCINCQAAMTLTADTTWAGQTPEIMLAGVIVNKTDTGNAVLLAVLPADGMVAVKLNDFCQAVSIGLESGDRQETLMTPIGHAVIPHNQLLWLNDSWYVSLPVLEKHLFSKLGFSAAELAIMFKPAWPYLAIPAEAKIIQPQTRLPLGGIRAPKVSLSRFRTELQYQFRDPQDTTFSTTDVGGTAFGGLWQARYRNYLEGDGRLEDYTYLLPGRNQRVLLGNQSVSVTPLLRGFEFTGAQYAWTNQPELLLNGNLQVNQLISSPFNAVQNINGQGGPPGGIAELRLDGRVVAREIVRLDGSYLFPEVELGSFGEQLIEVWLYRNRNDSSPEQIIDHSQFVSSQTLPAGTLLQHAGVGIEGNLIEGDQGDQGLAGFYQARYAPTDSLVFDVAYQGARDEHAGAVNALASLGRYGGLVEAGVASDGDSQAWSAEIQNQIGGWFWRGALRHEDGGFLDRVQDFDNRFIEAGYGVGRSLQVSIIARDLDDELRDFAYVLPTVSWRPSSSFSLRLRPDFEGDYTLTSFWSITPRQRFFASLNEELSTARWDYETGERRRLSVQGVHREGSGSSVGVVWQQFRTGVRELGWGAGLFYGSGSAGFLAQMEYEWTPGFYTRAEIFRDPLNQVNGSTDTVYTLSTVIDLALFNGGVARGNFRRELLNAGAVAGSLKIPGDYFNGDLAGIGILIDGQLRGRTQVGGDYAIQTLPPGIYQVRLDIGELPLELTPVNQVFWAEVDGGALTQVDFELQLQLGFAGQVTDAHGQPLAQVVVEITPVNGGDAIRVETNQFGYYRIDGLSPGKYLAAIISKMDQPQADDIGRNPVTKNVRAVELVNQFLFTQDIRL